MVALSGEPGVAVIAGRRVGGAVSRNKAKRRVKSYLRERDALSWGLVGVLLICKRGSDKGSYKIMVGELNSLFGRLKEWERSARGA